MELINKIRKSRKGFTLVEIIVVLVILAILAAFTIPAMLGFVNDAKSKAMIAEAREVYVAAQATATELSTKGDSSLTKDNLSKANIDEDNNTSEQMKKYLGGDALDVTGSWTVDITAGKVTAVYYTDKNNKHQIKLAAGSEVTVIS